MAKIGFAALLAAAAAKAVGELNVLLPFSRDVRVQHAIEAFGGCYYWRSSNPQIISVNAEGECSARAVLRAEAKELDDRVVWIVATDAATGEVIRVESRVQELRRVEIVTKLRTVEVGDFAMLELMGFDAQGNAFSTLEGLRFHWSVQQEGALAEFTTFREANMQPTVARAALEAVGQQGDLVVLKGLQIGPIRVTAMMRQATPAIAHSVDMYILEHFLIAPEEDLLVLPCDRVRLRLYVLRRDKGAVAPRPIALPNPKLRLAVLEPSAGLALSSDGALAVGENARGNYRVELSTENHRENRVEKRVAIAENFWTDLAFRELGEHESVASLRAAFEAFHPFATESASEDWRGGALFTFEFGRRYVLKASLRVDELREAHFSEARRVVWALPTDHSIICQFQNFVLFESTALSRGAALRARVASPEKCSQADASASKSYQTVSPVLLVAPMNADRRLYLPLSDGEKQTIRLGALGGSGEYKWSSADPRVAAVGEGGVVRALALGETRVRVEDSAVRANGAEATIVVASAARTFALENRKDFWFDESSPLLLGATAADGTRFANCSALRLETAQNATFSASMEAITYDEFLIALRSILSRSEFQPPNQKLHFAQHAPYSEHIARGEVSAAQLDAMLGAYENRGLCGVARVEASAPSEGVEAFALGGAKATEVKVVAHARDRFALPKEYDLAVFGAVPLVGVGAAARFSHENYPQNWFASAETRIRVLGDALAVSVRPIDATSAEVSVRCLSASNGESAVAIEFSVSDLSNFYLPFSTRHSVAVRCAAPTRFEIRHLADSPRDGTRFLLAPRPPQFGLRNDRSHAFVVWGFDAARTPFWVCGDAAVVWAASDFAVGSVSPRALAAIDAMGGACGAATLALTSQTGKLELSARATVGEPSDEVTINALNKLAIEPVFVALCHHSAVSVALRVVNGSGRFAVRGDAAIVKVEHRPQTREVIVRPFALGVSDVFVEDLEVVGDTEAVARVEVLAPTRVEVTLAERAMEEGRSTVARVQLFADERPIEDSQTAQIGFEIFGDSLQVRVARLSPITFNITASAAGTFTLVARSATGNLQSSPTTFVAYERLHLSPTQIALAPGCRAIVHVLGGPALDQRAAQHLQLRLVTGVRGLSIEQLADDRFEISAGENGAGHLRAELRGPTSTLHVAEAVIVIAPIDGMTFEHPAAVPVGTSLHITVIPTVHGVELAPGWCPTLVSGTIREPNLGEISPLFKGPRLAHSSYNHFNFTANAPGIATLAFELNLSSESEGRRRGAAIHDSTQLSILVEPAVVLLSQDRPPCAHTSLHLPTMTTFSLPPLTTTDARILSHDSVATLSPAGVLTTTSKQGFDVLVYRRGGDEPQFVTTVPVHVTAPRVLQLSRLSRAGLLAPGVALEIAVRAVDDRGRTFFAPMPRWDLRVSSSAPNVAEVTYSTQKNTLTIRAREPGQTLIALSSYRHPQLRLNWILHVGALLLPGGEIVLHVGGSVQLKPSALAGGAATEWRSSDTRIATVNSNGLVQALTAGRSTVGSGGPLEPSAEVFVVVADELRPMSGNPRILSNVASSQFFAPSYEFAFELAANGQSLRLTADVLVEQNLAFDCRTESNDLETRPRLGLAPGTFICEVRFRAQTGWSTLAKVEARITAPVPLLHTFEVQLQPLFAVVGGVTALHATGERPATKFVVRTSEALEVEAGELATYTQSQFFAHNTSQVISVAVPAGSSRPLRGRLRLASRVSGQRVELPFIYNPQPSFLSKLSLSFSTGAEVGLSDLLVIGVCLVIVYYIFAEYRRTK